MIEVMNVNGAWITGNVFQHGKTYSFGMKRLDVKSRYGVNGGRIILMWMLDESRNTLIDYDRGWSDEFDFSDLDEDSRNAFDEVVRQFG